MPRRELPLMLLVAGLMALGFTFVKIAVPVLGAAVLVDARVLGAALVLAAWMRWRGRPLAFGRGVGPYLVLGILNAALPFTLTAWGELRLDASLAAVLMATIPLFAALLAALLDRERLDGRRRLGLLLGLVGVAVLSGWRPSGFDVGTLPSLLALLAAALSYAAAAVYVRRSFAGVDRSSLTVGTFAAAGVVLAPLALAAPPAVPPGATVLAAMAGLVVLSTVISFRWYFVLIERAGPTVATSIGFLIPVFGAAWGAVLLGEALTPAIVIGGAIVLAAMRLVSGPAGSTMARGAAAPDVRAALHRGAGGNGRTAVREGVGPAPGPGATRHVGAAR
jgi:drug/metabolite transporter (DMT)-like permease